MQIDDFISPPKQISLITMEFICEVPPVYQIPSTLTMREKDYPGYLEINVYGPAPGSDNPQDLQMDIKFHSDRIESSNLYDEVSPVNAIVPIRLENHNGKFHTFCQIVGIGKGTFIATILGPIETKYLTPVTDTTVG